MSFQYYTKSLEELRPIVKILVSNMSWLVGCESNSNLWSPTVGYNACKELKLSGSNCTNISDEVKEIEYLSLDFSSVVNTTMKSIWSKVLNYDTSILDYDAVRELKVSSTLDTTSKVKVCISQSKTYNSTIYESIVNNPNIPYVSDYKRLMWILLAGYSIRNAIYGFSRGTSDTISKDILSDNFLNQTIKNIEYERYSLSVSNIANPEYKYSTDFISQQLALLMKNIRQLQSYVLVYIR